MIRLYPGSIAGAVSMIVPLPPVVQRAIDDVALRVTTADGHSTVRHFTKGTAEYLVLRYSRPTSESGLHWQVKRTED